MKKSIKLFLAILCVAAMMLPTIALGEGTTVEVLTWSNEATVQFLKSVKEEFEAAYPDYELVVTEVPSGEIDSIIQTRLLAGDVDIVSFQTFSKPQEEWNASSVDKPAWQDYVDNGQLVDLTDEEFIKNYNLDTLMGNSYNGRLYSVNIGTVAYTGMFYNKTIFDELGLSVPNTWDELMAICEAVKADGKYTVVSAGGGDQWPLNIFSNSIIGANYGEETKEFGRKLLTGELKHTDPEVMLVYNCMEDLAKYLEPGVTGIPYSDAPGRFALGNMALYIDGAWSWADIEKAAGEGFEYGYFACPPVVAREDGLVPQQGIKYDLSFSIPTSAPNVEGAKAFLTFISATDVYTRFINAIGFTPTQDNIAMDNAFFATLADGLQKPFLNPEMLLFTPKGVGEYGGGQFSFFYLRELGGEFDAQGLAEAAEADFDAARAALASLN